MSDVTGSKWVVGRRLVRDHRRAVGLSLVGFVGYLVTLAVCSEPFPLGFTEVAVGGIIALICLQVLVAVTGIRVLRFRCPVCGRAAFADMWAMECWTLGLRSTCIKCGAKIQE